MIKADVDFPVLGWDFVRHHKINFVWNEWGDITLQDPRAEISKTLEFKSIPFNKSRQNKNLAVNNNSVNSSVVSSAWLELIKLGVVEKVDTSSSNTYSSPVHFVPKPDGSLRPTGDFRALNKQTEFDLFPLPHLRDFTHKIKGCQIFSKVDLLKSFHQIVIDPRDRFKTCVTTPWGMFNFKRLAMGLQNAAQSFQRLLQDVVGKMDGIFIYLDDLLIYHKNKKDHLATLEELFRRLSSAGLTISTSKCVFGQKSIEYLGYNINSSGISPIPRKIAAIHNFPPPQKIFSKLRICAT